MDRVFQSNYHHRHVFVDKGDRAVLHLSRRVSLGVDIGNFLEFQGTFEGGREIDTSSEIQAIARLVIVGRYPGNPVLALED